MSKIKIITLDILTIMLILTNVVYCGQTYAKQYNVSNYYKIRIVDGKECYFYYSYINGKEQFISVTCK